MIKITISTENDAFVPEPWPEVKRILQNIEANTLEDLDRKKLYDLNGNPVGLIQVNNNIKTTYKASGAVFGDLWGGSSGGYPAREVRADTIEQLKEKIRTMISTGELDSGMGFRNLRGALMEITTIEQLTHENGKTYTNETSVLETFGNITAEEEKTLQQYIEREL